MHGGNGSLAFTGSGAGAFAAVNPADFLAFNGWETALPEPGSLGSRLTPGHQCRPVFELDYEVRRAIQPRAPVP